MSAERDGVLAAHEGEPSSDRTVTCSCDGHDYQHSFAEFSSHLVEAALAGGEAERERLRLVADRQKQIAAAFRDANSSFAAWRLGELKMWQDAFLRLAESEEGPAPSEASSTTDPQGDQPS